jgi:hypothetical protein
MKVWSERDIPRLMDTLNEQMWRMENAVMERDVRKLGSVVRAMRTTLGCMDECVGDESDV